MIEFNTNTFIQNPIFDQVRSPGMQQLGQGISQLLAGAAHLLESAAQIIQNGGAHQFGPEVVNNPFTPVSPPTLEDSGPPSGNLSTEGGKVTTPGGYQIEPLGQYEWKITGPDGKSTRVWGDPHVAEGDGGAWDFKRDSTFVLGDGTRINVATKPYGNMTVTSGLEILSGNDRVNKSTQLRRFYDELVMWQEKVGTSADRFAELQPYIYMLKAKVAYARGREHVDANFETLMRRVIDQAVDPGTLRQAKLFMEAFMAFYKVHNK